MPGRQNTNNGTELPPQQQPAERGTGWNEPDSLAQQTLDLAEDNRRLRKALADALEGMQDMRPYVPEYFAEKWNHDTYIERAKTALGSTTEQPTETSASEGPHDG